MVLLIDNYDSFTFNLAQCLGALGASLVVRRNDEISVEDIAALGPERIVISPGPGRPESAGVSIAAVRAFGAHLPILGVCLGHQAIGVAFGARVTRACRQMHGKTSMVCHDGSALFAGLPPAFEAARYHSLHVEPASVPPVLAISARAVDDGTIMSMRHCEWPIHGVQFHPESIKTPEGRRILQHFLEL